MAIARQFLLAQIRISGFKLNIPCEWHMCGTHQRVLDVIANTRQTAEANQIALTELLAVAAHGMKVGVICG